MDGGEGHLDVDVLNPACNIHGNFSGYPRQCQQFGTPGNDLAPAAPYLHGLASSESGHLRKQAVAALPSPFYLQQINPTAIMYVSAYSTPPHQPPTTRCVLRT